MTAKLKHETWVERFLREKDKWYKRNKRLSLMKKKSFFMTFNFQWVTDSVHTFHFLTSTGFYWSHNHSPLTALTAKWIPLDDCSGPAMLWLRASPVYISLMDSHSNLPEQTYPSCTAKPLENTSLWQFQACLRFSNGFSEMFFPVTFVIWVRIKIESDWLMSAHLLKTAFSSCASFFFSDK